MAGIALLLFGAAAAHLVARVLRTPQIPFLLLAGVVLSATGLLDEVLLEEALPLGVAVLLFANGTELHLETAPALRRAAISRATG